jgi:hypothetical protein
VVGLSSALWQDGCCYQIIIPLSYARRGLPAASAAACKLKVLPAELRRSCIINTSHELNCFIILAKLIKLHELLTYFSSLQSQTLSWIEQPSSILNHHVGKKFFCLRHVRSCFHQLISAHSFAHNFSDQSSKELTLTIISSPVALPSLSSPFTSQSQ